MTDRHGESAPSAFTTTDKLIAFLDDGKSGHWKVSLIADREALIIAIADAHLEGVSTVWLDPKPGDTPSDSIRLIDLAELSRQLAPA